MAFPLINPRPDYTPSGTLEFRDPATNAYVNTYPTADDADAATNANDNPILLDSAGRASVYLPDGVVVRVIHKDEDGTTVWTEDDVNVPAVQVTIDDDTVTTFTSGDATPSVLNTRSFITAGTTAITDFDDGVVGQIIYILAAVAITITNGASISLKGAADFDMLAGDSLVLHMFDDQVWTEISRNTAPATAEVVAATNVITAKETGKTFFLNSATEFASTLPAPVLGLAYTFIVTAAPSGASYTVGTDSGSNIMEVLLLDVVGELTRYTGRDVVTFVDGVSLVGDRLEVVSDGSKWFCKAFSGADGGITTGVT